MLPLISLNMKTPVPTDTQPLTYRTRDGKDVVIATMTTEQLIEALFDMLMRKAKHNHKINKMFNVGDILSEVVMALHQELGNRETKGAPLNTLQIAADLGHLSLVKTADTVSLQSTHA